MPRSCGSSDEPGAWEPDCGVSIECWLSTQPDEVVNQSTRDVWPSFQCSNGTKRAVLGTIGWQSSAGDGAQIVVAEGRSILEGDTPITFAI